jgi:hypothetical protein
MEFLDVCVEDAFFDELVSLGHLSEGNNLECAVEEDDDEEDSERNACSSLISSFKKKPYDPEDRWSDSEADECIAPIAFNRLKKRTPRHAERSFSRKQKSRIYKGNSDEDEDEKYSC